MPIGCWIGIESWGSEMKVGERIAAGELNRRVTVQARATTQDTYGGQDFIWTDLFTAWASINPMSGRELVAAQAAQSDSTHEIKMRYRSEFANPTEVQKYRILYKARIFNVKASMNQEERNRVVVLQAQEGLNNG